MSSLEKLTATARALINRLKDDEITTEGIISDMQTLQKKVDVMKQVRIWHSSFMCIKTYTNCVMKFVRVMFIYQ